MSKDIKSLVDEFQNAVNMTPKELESWLKTDESKSVGQKDGASESIGHKEGKYIADLLQKKEPEYTDEDYTQMKRIISYIHRHSAQRPSGDIENTRWCYSLKNWGHDPLK